MTTPATILRDAAIAGLVLSLVGCLRGWEFGASVAAGALASLVNLFLLWRAVSGAGTSPDAFVRGRLVFKTLAGALLLLVLLKVLPAAPVLVGFCSVMLALAVRAFASLAAGPGTSPSEAG